MDKNLINVGTVILHLLKRHIRLAHETKPYKCKICDKKFGSSKLQIHIANVHLEKTPSILIYVIQTLQKNQG